MAKEDFVNGKEPIDMKNYPYRAGQVLDNGITIRSIVRGDVNDSFGGFLYKTIVERKGDRIFYGDDVVFPSLGEASDPDHSIRMQARAIDVRYIKTLGDPWAQRVVYHLPGANEDSICTPEEFLEIAKNGKPESNAEATEESQDDETAVVTCQGTTKAGEPCKRPAVSGEKFCSAHMR